MPTATGQAEEARWAPLYRVGAGVALAMFALVPLAVLGFLIAPTPSSALEAFALFERSTLLGLIGLDLIYMVEIVLAGLLLTVLAVALRRVAPATVVVAAFLNVVATAIYFASNPAFEMVALSRQWAAAGTELERRMVLTVGEALIASYKGGTAYNVSYVLAGAAGLLLALVMLRSEVFGRATAYLGVVMGVLALIPPTVGVVGVIAAFAYLLPLLVWLVLVARTLAKLGRPPRQEEAGQPLARLARGVPQT